jgi:hypothetical protein
VTAQLSLLGDDAEFEIRSDGGPSCYPVDNQLWTDPRLDSDDVRVIGWVSSVVDRGVPVTVANAARAVHLPEFVVAACFVRLTALGFLADDENGVFGLDFAAWEYDR